MSQRVWGSARSSLLLLPFDRRRRCATTVPCWASPVHKLFATSCRRDRAGWYGPWLRPWLRTATKPARERVLPIWQVGRCAHRFIWSGRALESMRRFCALIENLARRRWTFYAPNGQRSRRCFGSTNLGEQLVIICLWRVLKVPLLQMPFAE